MATESKTVTPKTEVFTNAAELVIDGLNAAAKQREEVASISREGLEKMNALVRASGQTSLDLFDFSVKMAGAWHNASLDAIHAVTGIAKKAAARA